MGKMSDRRRKKRKFKTKLSKLMKSLKDAIKIRIPYAKAGTAFKSPKDYNKKQNKEAIEKAMKEHDE